MLPPGVLHMSALGCFGRFTLFSPRVSHSNTCRLLSFVCFVLLFGFVALVCFCFLFCECLGIPNSPRSLDLDDRQGLIARSAMQQKKKTTLLDFLPLSSSEFRNSRSFRSTLPVTPSFFSLWVSRTVDHSGPLFLLPPPSS